MRINKYLAESGFCSRRKADRLIEEGKVTINGKIAELGDQADESDKVAVNGTQLSIKDKQDIFIVFNKPVGVISTADENAENTVFDYIDIEERLFYIGRLDVISSGLMLLTNNGDVANNIAHARGDHEKEYIVQVDKPVTKSFMDQMRLGVKLDDGKTKEAKISKTADNRFKLTITEGKNRQIRRMCEALGYEVKRLRRTRIMNIKLGDLGEGNWRQLTKRERRELLEQL